MAAALRGISPHNQCHWFTSIYCSVGLSSQLRGICGHSVPCALLLPHKTALFLLLDPASYVPVPQFSLEEPVCQGTLNRHPATSASLLREACVEDAYGIKLLWKTLTGSCGPWHTAYGYSSMPIRLLCLFLLASHATFTANVPLCIRVHPFL
jgi:hypothetical protein